MKKAVVNFIYLSSIVLSFISMHEALADRGPSVEPFTEVDIENTKGAPKNSGFNFDEAKKREVASERKPAGITYKDPKNVSTPYSIIGPIIFLLTLPIAIWLMISRKLNKADQQPVDKTEYYAKNHQFKPYQTDYQKSDDDHDDFDVPKAS